MSDWFDSHPPVLPPPKEEPEPLADETPARQDAELRWQLARMILTALTLVGGAAALLNRPYVGRWKGQFAPAGLAACAVWWLLSPGPRRFIASVLGRRERPPEEPR
jgi:hypothetical protein